VHLIAKDSIVALGRRRHHRTKDTIVHPAAVKALWPDGPLTPVQWSAETTTVSLEGQRYYFPHKSNVPVIDSFVLIRKGKTLSLLCFQITIAEEHRTTAAKLRSFFVEELLKRFRYKERPLKLIIPAAGSTDGLKLRCGTATLKLDVHLVYVLSPRNYRNFKYQTLEKSTAAADAEWARCWTKVNQYKCRTPTKRI
jgi:hypothetical protein